MILSSLFMLAMAAQSLTCPVLGGPARPNGEFSDFRGVRYRYCCPGCKSTFDKSPNQAISKALGRGGVFGTSLKDPVSGRALTLAKGGPTSVYAGVIYPFVSSANKKAFDANPRKFVRTLSATVPSKPRETSPSPTTARLGKYLVELRLPEEGLFAGDEVDVEFRVSDQTKDDPIEGKRGVPNASPTASVTMPSMPGMPVVRPHVHSEGIPGDYGLELFFPHGGDYRVAIRLTPPEGTPVEAKFNLNVKDAEARKNVPVVKPFAVDLLDFPKSAKSGERLKLKLAIRDTKTGERVMAFDEAHTKLIHLIVVSKDFGWFAHEHPTPNPDGSFEMNWTFPAGGDYLVFADVAPKDKGSQVLSTLVHVQGPTGTWPKRLVPTHGPSRDGGIVAEFHPLTVPIPIGRMTTVAFRLKDAATGKPVVDLEPYLGAHGHLMIIHQDGQVFVHSHPAEDAQAMKLTKQGEVRFNARFPKAGMYKAWAQFQRHGKVVTVPFVFEVK